MHEFNVTEKLFQVALENAQLTDQERIKRLHITLDPDSGYIPDAIRFYFEHLAKDTPAEGAILDFDLAAEPNRIALNSLEIEVADKESAADILITRQRLTITGLVQGVGFRPFVHTLAQQTRVSGWVQNTAFGVELEVQGTEADVAHFLHHLRHDGPPLARILSIQSTGIPPISIQESRFEIHASQDQGGRTLISPDVATCPRCLSELFDPTERRFHYPFTNCTHCGPRFTIIQHLPYDRFLTTMANLPMCSVCEAEYRNPKDRRFHAQPVACPDCGPLMRYVTSGRTDNQMVIGEAALQAASNCLRDGGIVAVKGIGGFHLACRADDVAVIQQLRVRKFRPHQPFAVMVRNLREAQAWCHLSSTEEALLLSQEAPIVLLPKRSETKLQPLFEALAPQNAYLGLILPYTPLHHLLLQQVAAPLVMTSGNYHQEPLCIDDDEACQRLASLCDGFLLHNRPIAHRCDDSLIFHLSPPTSKATTAKQTTDTSASLSGIVQPIRRSRGLAPLPILLPETIATDRALLVTGADLKNVSALVQGRQVFLTPHIGNLSHPLARVAQANTLTTFEYLFKIDPQVIVCDLHPDYVSHRYARQRAALHHWPEQEDLPLIEVQHHHAHIAACLAENDYCQTAIGLSFDGTGYGLDGHIWGGEVLVADLNDFQRAYQLEYLPLPGGEAAIKHPDRIAAAYIQTLLPDEDLPARFPHLPIKTLQTITTMLTQKVNVPLTSSMGRLFDVVSALLGLCSIVTYEGQAAISLEQAALTSQYAGPAYSFALAQGQIKLASLLADILRDIDTCQPTVDIARRFHITVADLALTAAKAVQQEYSTEARPLNTVALSGGVWQNRLLLTLTLPRLQEAGFQVLLHHAVPANDGGLAYGQTAIAAAHLAIDRNSQAQER